MPNNNITPINEQEALNFIDDLDIETIKKEVVPELEEKIVIKLPEWDLIPPNEIIDRSETND